MAHPSSDRRRRARLLGRALVFGGLAAIGMAAGCGGALSPKTAPDAPSPEPLFAEDAILDALLDPPTPVAHTDRWRVNPTMSTATRPGVRLDPVARRTGWSDAIEALADGRWPSDAPPHAFVAAVGRYRPGVTVALDASPVRPGYHALLISIGSPAVAPASRSPVTIILEARRGLLDTAQRAVVSGMAGPLQNPTPLRLIVAAETPTTACPETGSTHRWRACIDALDPAGPADLTAALDGVAAELGGRRRPIVIARGPVPHVPGIEPIVIRPAALSRSSAWAELIEAAATATPYLTEVSAQVDFDPRRVGRYRLIGFDGGAATAQGRGGIVWHGRGESLLFEVELRPEATEGALGVVTVRGRGADDRIVEMRHPLVAAGSPEDAALAVVAAATAERMRGAWWARRVDWAALREIHAALPEPVRARPPVMKLGELIDQAEALGLPTDRFAEHGPTTEMDLHRVPEAPR